MKVNKEIYYHANSENNVKVGDILVFNNDTHNRMYDEVYNSEYKLNNVDANELLFNKKRIGNTDLSVDEFLLVYKTINNDAFVLN